MKQKIKFGKRNQTPTQKMPDELPWPVLVADDDPEVLMLTKEIMSDFVFKNRGIKIHFASSGEEAKKILLQESKIAVAMLDVMMEQADTGLQLVEYIRGEQANPFLRVILRTGQSDKIPENQLFEHYDINDFLEKGDLTSMRLKVAFKSALRSYMQVAELEHLRQTAEVANKSKSVFLANMSHELRSPMQAMISFSAMGMNRFHITGHERMMGIDFEVREKWIVETIMKLDDDSLREKALFKLIQGLPRYFFRIHNSTHRLMGLINNLLDLAKLESGKMDYDFRRQKLLPIVELQVAEIAPLLQEKNLQVEIHHALTNPEVECDGGKVMQVLRNLLSNAVKFSHDGGLIEIRFSKEFLDAARSGIRIDVLDKGIGIPQDQLSTIFEPFEQSMLTKNGAGGTGLGLAICRKYVEAHQGRIWAENRSEGGSALSFTLPDIQRIQH
ncbi:MAG: hybrid sensor histidine kinase/response regulator [Magnetococcales bacterium]|nr:hybrid sensor histidine kinase/response regulator [Magnetococcales bacterium]